MCICIATLRAIGMYQGCWGAKLTTRHVLPISMMANSIEHPHRSIVLRNQTST